MQFQPYLTFDGNAAEAMKFYERLFGGKIEQMMTFGDMPPEAAAGMAEACPGAPQGPMPEEMKKPGLQSLDDIIRLTTAHAVNEGTIRRAIDNDFAARGVAYRELPPDAFSEVRSIALERHRALNWLCGRAPDNAWDETPVET